MCFGSLWGLFEATDFVSHLLRCEVVLGEAGTSTPAKSTAPTATRAWVKVGGPQMALVPGCAVLIRFQLAPRPQQRAEWERCAHWLWIHSVSRQAQRFARLLRCRLFFIHGEHHPLALCVRPHGRVDA